jgi:hypothetical protein
MTKTTEVAHHLEQARIFECDGPWHRQHVREESDAENGQRMD